MQTKKSPKNWVLGSIWEGVGALGAVFWPLLGAFWPFFGRSESHLFKAWAQDGPQEAFWVDFGLILKGFGRVLRAFWEHFGRFLKRFCFDFGKVLIYEGELVLHFNSTLHAKVWLTLFEFFCVGTPALPRYAPRSVTMRGVPPPAWLNRTGYLNSSLDSFLDSQ